MVDESELVKRYNAYKERHKDSTWRDVCHNLALHMLELEMKIEELTKPAKSPEVEKKGSDVGSAVGKKEGVRKLFPSLRNKSDRDL